MPEFARHLQLEHDLGSSLWDRSVAATEATRSTLGHTDLPGLVWGELKRGECYLVDSFVTDDRCYAVTVQAGPQDASRAPQTHLTLERALLGASQKQLCSDAQRAVSTIGLSMKNSLQLFGASVTPSKVPLILVIMARASARAVRVSGTRSSQCLQDGVSYRLVSLARPESRLAGQLSSAELAIARYLVEGKTHQEIAVLRHSAIRTVANQVGSVFRKLGVSGRSEMMWFLADCALSVGKTE